jgi:hypothetical protein
MNWGKGILIAMIAFMSFIIILVVGFFSHRVDLESEDYYMREMAYEEEMGFLNNANALSENAEISVQDGHVVVQLSEKYDYSDVELALKRPDDSQDDKTFQIENTHTFIVPGDAVRDGKYIVELSYIANDQHCLQKEEIYLK